MTLQLICTILLFRANGQRILLQTPSPIAVPAIPDPVATLIPNIPMIPTDPKVPEIPVVINNPAQVTPAPTTLSPTAPAPTTANPTTALPTTSPTVSAPDGFQYGAHGQFCPIPPLSASPKCVSRTDVLTDLNNEGYIDCNQYLGDCCMCSLIECGHNALNVPCRTVNIGPSGAVGTVIHVRGDEVGGGALIQCQGAEGCRFAMIEATNVLAMDCDGERSCEGATVHIVDPQPGFYLDCSGIASCIGLRIDMEFSNGPPDGFMCDPSRRKELLQFSGIQCGNRASCQGMELSINNNGCDRVRVENINCLQTDSCDLAQFALIGDVEVVNCECGPSCNTASGLAQCFKNLNSLLCPDEASCSGQTKTIVNTLNGFKFECGNVRSCELAQFTFEYNRDAAKPRPVESIDAFVFGGEYSARDSTFTFVNNQGFEGQSQIPVILTVDRIECSGLGSCDGATFITGRNVEIKNVKCAPLSCLNCMIKLDAADIGRACDPEQINVVPVPQTPAIVVVSPPTPRYVPIPQQNGNGNGNGQWVPV